MAISRPAGDFDRSYQQDMSVLRQSWQWVMVAVGTLGVLVALAFAPALVDNDAVRWVATIARAGLALIILLIGIIVFLSPIWVPIGFAVFWLWLPERWRMKKDKAYLNPVCRKCGYDMKAHGHGQRCPECGTVWRG